MAVSRSGDCLPSEDGTVPKDSKVSSLEKQPVEGRGGWGRGVPELASAWESVLNLPPLRINISESGGGERRQC